VSLPQPSCVVDTVVLLYFLLAGEAGLLIDTLGPPLATPRIIYDPDEGDVPDIARSEMTRSVAYHQQIATDPTHDSTARDRAATNAKRLVAIIELYRANTLVTMDLTIEELGILGNATSPTRCGSYGLLFPLSPGEAACLAIALTRNLPLATDDGDALRALRHARPNHPYQRIRKLLIQSVNQRRISRARANAIHRDMTSLGFWDSQLPFPGEP
jgi:hypothetical protein